MLCSSMSAQHGSMLTEVCREMAATLSRRVPGAVKCRQAHVARHQRHLEPNAVQRSCTRQAKSKACDRTRLKTAASAPDGAAANASKAPIDPAGPLSTHFARNLGLSRDMIQELAQLPGTKNMDHLRDRAQALSQWKTSMQQGYLPEPGTLDWPVEPFQSSFVNALDNLAMPRFTRRYPKLLDSLLRQMMQLVHDFEAEAESQQEQQAPPKPDDAGKPPPPQQSQGQGQDGEGEEGEPQPGNKQETSPEDMEEALKQGMEAQAGAGEGQEIEMSMEMDESRQGNQGEGEEGTEEQEGEGDAKSQPDLSKLADDLVQKFEEQWKATAENLDAASKAFDNLEDLMDGKSGFDSSTSVWQQTGWGEVDNLRKKLENLKELRDLVRQLGRAGGKGPLRKAPQEIWSSGKPPGVVRSPLQPEETRGLTRSDDLSRMLPFEAHLIAAGWPRNDTDADGNEVVREGSRPARLLHLAGLIMSPPGLEVRPAAELGPIIVCLDTSGSMSGARETVAKAVTLECMRGAVRQKRACFLGPGQVMEMELKVDSNSMAKLLKFLTGGFNGGTDVDKPLELSLKRLAEKEWNQADILMVTDGEIPRPSEWVKKDLKAAVDDLGLEIHGLLVGQQDSTPAMQDICTHLHVFKSWSAVGGKRNYYY
ncbi:MAG: hypothetical protein FRX49_13645 [Trebouxia sp. A1-2]|nr:MAG: hypothetical protein FRX49_13645 [Trebouxia sp. A1-2]